MSFATPLFLWLFLPSVLGVMLIAPRTWRNGVLSVASLVFYAMGAGSFILLLVSAMLVNFLVGPALEHDEWDIDRTRRRSMLIGAVSFNLLILAIWKYAGFASQQIDNLASLLGGSSAVLEIVLPIGISFFTFHHISYLVDIYRGERQAARRPVDFVTYIAMFPQLVAGPIVRYHEIADQLPQVRMHRLDDIAAGFPRFALGLTKKVVIADQLAPVVAACFNTPDSEMTAGIAWLGAVAYTMQLFFDFSGYSDMAIGIARMFGFRLPENFARPYSSASITEFWRRWHMSLSRWFRDYVYVPLGGNRFGTKQTYRNLGIVFLLTGIWHGAAWTFVIWGIYHGAWLMIERRMGWSKRPAAGPRLVLRRATTMLIVLLGWVVFRAADLGSAMVMLGHMALPLDGGLSDVVAASLTNQRLVVLLLALLVVLLPTAPVSGPLVEAGRGRSATAYRVGLLTAGLAYSSILVAAGTFSPFLYFQF